MNTLKDLKRFSETLGKSDSPMPVLFIGHGSPMNGIQDNEFSQGWAALGKSLPVPRAVLVISAHWLTRGTFVTAMEQPRTIHDFGGFPKALFDVQYPAPGLPSLAQETKLLIKKVDVGLDHDWGLDHGSWTVIRRMYPDANVPVLQFSIDFSKDLKWHYDLAAELAELRKRGVLILGSGNMVHNLRMLNWQEPDSVYDWAAEMNDKFKELIIEQQHDRLIDYASLGKAAQLSIPTTEHYIPLIYTLGVKRSSERLEFFNDKTVMGSISMTSLLIRN